MKINKYKNKNKKDLDIYNFEIYIVLKSFIEKKS